MRSSHNNCIQCMRRPFGLTCTARWKVTSLNCAPPACGRRHLFSPPSLCTVLACNQRCHFSRLVTLAAHLSHACYSSFSRQKLVACGLAHHRLATVTASSGAERRGRFPQPCAVVKPTSAGQSSLLPSIFWRFPTEGRGIHDSADPHDAQLVRSTTTAAAVVHANAQCQVVSDCYDDAEGKMPPNKPTAAKRDANTDARNSSATTVGTVDLRALWAHGWTLSKGRLSVWVALSALPGHLLLLSPSATAATTSSSASAGLAACSAISFSQQITLSHLPAMSLASAAIPGTLATASCLLVGTFLCSASANCWNQINERHLDRIMPRTRRRPLASGALTVSSGTVFAVSTAVLGVSLLAAGTNLLTAGLAVLNIGLYACVYTPLKVLSPYNTHIGSVVGSIPVIMGSTAITGSLVGLPLQSWALFGIQTLWQFPHFYALAWLYREDYAKAGYRMFPITDETGLLTARMIKPYMYALTLLPLVTSIHGLTTYMFAVDSLVPNCVLFYYLRRFEDNPSKGAARKFFLHSLWHLLVLLMLAVYHSHGMANTDRVRQEQQEHRHGSSAYTQQESRDVPSAGHTKGRDSQSWQTGVDMMSRSDQTEGLKRQSSEDGEERTTTALGRTAASEDLFLELRRYFVQMCPHSKLKGLQDHCPLDPTVPYLNNRWLSQQDSYVPSDRRELDTSTGSRSTARFGTPSEGRCGF